MTGHAAPRSFWSRYVVSTDHKVIGLQYLGIALVFLVIGGVLSLLIRWELKDPEATFDPDFYNRCFTMHGTIMIFFSAIPLLTGAFGNYLVPLQIGARDMAFPRVNALSVWIFLAAGLLMLSQFFVPGGAFGATWLAYPPLSILDAAAPARAGKAIWSASLVLMGFSSILGGLNVLVTVVTMRAPGVGWWKIPVFTWSLFLASVLVIGVVPFLSGALILLFLDQTAGFGFFLPRQGGSPLLWEHLFWFFGHPEVYIALLPLYGIVGEILPVFSRKTLYGYRFIVICMIVTSALSFFVWGHHMYTSGMNPFAAGFFMVWTKMISVPAGVIVLSFIATIWRGDVRFQPPLLFAVSFVVAFICGGLTGFFNATIPVDMYVHDTYWVVGHFHVVLVSAAVSAIFAGLYFWWPKMTGRKLNETLGRIHFAGTFVLLLAIFGAMHLVGLAGMRREIAVYEPAYKVPNLWISLGAFLLIGFQLLFVGNLVWSLFRGERAEDNPWGSRTLEWATTSPPPHENFPGIPSPLPDPYGYGGPEDLPPTPAAAPHAVEGGAA